MLDETQRDKVVARLNRIQGQINGIRRMVDEETYCVDVLLQIAAARAALGKVGQIMLANHIETCVVDAFASGDEGERRDKIDELLEVFSRYGRLEAK